ncbi:hypothetical protein GCM10022236_27500 [Microlunatus ginsengisoli]|uniref:TrwC relaxase domain-containing protein n=1 Tax=Microlunatus ginsengisoli TaxID=363863 RepID=A0ABP7A2G2_9ACTN
MLHAGNGYTYLTRSVAACDARLGRSESLADYYVAKGQPPGRWAGRGAVALNVSGVVTEAQMKSLFGEGRHPDADAVVAGLVAAGVTPGEADRAARLGRRFPTYQPRPGVARTVADARAAAEQKLGRPLSEEERLAVRRTVLAAEYRRRHGRAAVDPIELEEAAREGAGRREAVAGYDLVFTPVKSVAVLWGIGSESTRRAIFDAHTAAVADCLNWLETNAAFTRTGDKGQAQIDVTGVTAAVFHHWDSRAGDPDLHTHVAVSNKVQGADGTWRSLDGRPLFAAAVSLSERYNTRIEDELRDRLGVTFTERASDGEPGRRLVREVDGIPADLLVAFSKRRQGIEGVYADLVREYRNAHGREPSKTARWSLYQQATLAQRPDKPAGRSLLHLVAGWKAEAGRVLGVTDAGRAVEAAALHHTATAVEVVDVGRVADVVVGVLQGSRATWTEHHVRAEAHRQLRSYPTVDRDGLVESVVVAACQPGRVLRIEIPRTMAEPAALRRSSGESVFVEHASARYTTIALLDAEERIVTAARQTSSNTGVDPVLVDRALAAAVPALNVEQVSMARVFACSDRFVLLGLAPAGAGKTTTMRVVVQAWQASGRPVVALAPSAVAADILRAELGVDADTLAKFDHDQPSIAAGTLILVDEAGMAGTLMLDRLIDRARRANAVVRLLGDDQQLGAVEAGGVIRQLAADVGAVRMRQVVRFTDPAEAAATLAVRNGDPAAVDFYLSHNRVTAATTETAPDAAYQAWLADVSAGRDALLLTSSGAAVAGLNSRARADLVVAGLVDVDGVALRDGTAAGVGDRVTTRRNDRRLAVCRGRDWVKNGDSWTVQVVHDDGALTVTHRGHGGRVTLPADYVAAHVQLDYARTIHRAQGATVEVAHLLVDPAMAREDLYVGLSRARTGTRLYVAIATDPGSAHPPEVAGSTRQVLTSIIQRSGVEPSATETVRQAVAGIGDLRRMAVEYEHALGTHVGDHYKDVAERHHPGVSTDRAWPSVAQRLHLGEAAGADPDRLIGAAGRLGGYIDAHSVARVLVHRLDLLLARAQRQQAGPPPAVPSWLAAAPPTHLSPPWDRYLPGRYAEMNTRISTLVAEAQANHAGWLGRVGDQASPGWGEAARQVVAYRAVYDIRGDDPLGPEPDMAGRQLQAWQAAHHAITACHSRPDEPRSAAERLLATLADHERDGRYDDDHRTDTRGGPSRHL